ncbi:unnamed protein product [Hymenolepis diminuta]|uniref:Reverse transcriptase RNase H-like domain-containing protein n=1 Tax=Hymenolepis diminuta TaxID=6216 RepID=A0A564Y011_HYMDI|nr:unnamed protein product [Hymenolepis diminuta]
MDLSLTSPKAKLGKLPYLSSVILYPPKAFDQLVPPEGRQFTIFTDHNPLTYASRASSDHYSPREIRHLDYVLQFTDNIKHFKGYDNIGANCLSRTNVAAVTKAVDFHSFSEAQKTDSELQEFRNRLTTLQLKDIPLHTTTGLITYGVSTGLPRHLLCQELSDAWFSNLFTTSHTLANGQLQNSSLIVLFGHLEARTSQIGRRLAKRANERNLISTL